NLDAQRANAFGRHDRGTRPRILQPDPRPLRHVAEISRELGARHDVVLSFEETRPHGAHGRVGDVLELRMLARPRDPRALARERGTFGLEPIARIAQRSAIRTHDPDEQYERQQDQRAEDHGTLVARLHRAPPHWPGPGFAAGTVVLAGTVDGAFVGATTR